MPLFAASKSRTWSVLAILAGLVGCDAWESGSAETSELAEEVHPEAELILPIPLEVAFDRERAALGERLFRDTTLSRDGMVSCTSCHDLVHHGGADGRIHAALPGRPPGPVNVPTVLNVTFNFRWSWSGRFATMEEQLNGSMQAPHAMATTVDAALPNLAPTYGSDFARVYPDGLTADNVRDALTHYLASLTTPNSRFDRFLRGEAAAINEREREGWRLFREAGCVSCHQGVNVGGNLFEHFGVVENYVASRRTPTPADLGLGHYTHVDSDRFLFRVPSLRNVELTAPYFHDGSASTLEDAVQVMARYQLGRTFRDDQVADIASFLRTLTGELPRD